MYYWVLKIPRVFSDKLHSHLILRKLTFGTYVQGFTIISVKFHLIRFGPALVLEEQFIFYHVSYPCQLCFIVNFINLSSIPFIEVIEKMCHRVKDQSLKLPYNYNLLYMYLYKRSLFYHLITYPLKTALFSNLVMVNYMGWLVPVSSPMTPVVYLTSTVLLPFWLLFLCLH